MKNARFTWMIYGASGYSGRMIAAKAVECGLKPVLDGRRIDPMAEWARELGLECREFGLEDPDTIVRNLQDVDAVVCAAGPYSVTARPMVEACIRSGTHYFDITGEIDVFEYLHSSETDVAARSAGVTLCSGIGLDVIPTDSLARTLVDALPDATELQLGFAGEKQISPGTAKSMIEGLAVGTLGRRDGQIVPIPLEVRDIDFGRGREQSMSISWGDVSTAYYTTGIDNITTFWPAGQKDIRQARMASWLRPLLRVKWVQNYLKKQIEKRVVGPDTAAREANPTYVWGQARNASGETVTARVRTANGYSLTFDAPPMIIRIMMENALPAGSHKPTQLFGKEFVTDIPDSSTIEVVRGA